MRVFVTVVIVLFSLLSAGSVIFSLAVLMKILATKRTFADKMKKAALSLPTFMLSAVLLASLLETLRSNSLVAVFTIAFTIPVQISFIFSILLTIRILKDHTIIKDWNSRFKAAYITICIVAILYFGYIMAIIILSIIGGYPIW